MSNENQNSGFGSCPTVVIEDAKGNPVRINESDYNKDIHDIYEAEDISKPTSRAELIVEDMGRMDKEDDEQWLKDGRPDIEILRDEAELQDITSPERNAAWESFLEDN